MVLGYHLILGAYGFWLPNDPRGSWSDFVGAWELARFGQATKTDTRCSVAGAPHDATARRAAKQALRYPDVHFTGLQARAIGRAFAAFAEKSGLMIWACSILPEHAHLAIGRHRHPAEQVANLLKGEATREIIAEGLHPLARLANGRRRPPKMWARGHWKVFLNTPEDVERAVRYVQDNPLKEGRPPQRWAFVRPPSF